MASQFCGISEEYLKYRQYIMHALYAMVLLLPYESLKGKTCETGTCSRLAGSRFITFVFQPVVGDSWPPDYEQTRKYGRTFKLISNNEPQDGDEINVTLYTNDDDDDSKINFTIYWHSHKTLLTLLEETGFVNVKFQNCQVKPEEYVKNEEQYWRYLFKLVYLNENRKHSDRIFSNNAQ
ncbi:20044_t:CDS:2 [Dentiscutata erythropus]|uniref:20044_t:CDS:1 n=1 Tax=Dentiscutata erythropus TaxID=1348616 RepID=A0A9N9IV90_9GLOM|nr:20044_t:CDS:2 [Dentiscutata erythropus]